MRWMTAVPTLLLVTLGCNKPPGAPAISITPATPTTADDLVVVIESESGGPGDDTVTYRIKWYEDEVLRPDLADGIVPAAQTAKGQTWRAVVIPLDGKREGEPGEAAVTVLNALPVVTAELSPEAPLSTDDLVVSAAATDPDEDPVTLAYAWAVDGVASEHTGTTVPASATTRGEVWEVVVTPHDGEEEGAAASASVNIENTAPAVLELSLSPDEPREADTIEASVVSSDDDGDEVACSYAWSVDGELVQESAEPSITGDLFDKHQQVTVTVTPNDGWVDGEPLTSSSVVVLNTAPAISAVALDPADLQEATTVSCLPSGWEDADGDAEGYLYSWTVAGTEVATIETLDGDAFDRGDVVFCTVTPNDGEEDGLPVTSAEATVSNTPPVISELALSASSPATGDTLAVSITASDDDGDEITYEYAWYVDSSLVASTATLDGSYFSRDQTILVEVTPYDGIDHGAAVTSEPATVVNSLPSIALLTLTPSEAYTDDVLTAGIVSSDADGDPVSFTYAWYVDSVLQVETGSSLDGATSFDKHQQVYVVITPADVEGDGSSATSPTVVVLNSPPLAPTVSISPVAPTAGLDDLVCVLDAESPDADDDTVSHSFVWTVDGVAYGGAVETSWPGDTVPAEDVVAGEEWTCTVVPDDGEDRGESAEASVTVLGGCSAWDVVHLSGWSKSFDMSYQGEAGTGSLSSVGAATSDDGIEGYLKRDVLSVSSNPWAV